MKSIEEMYKELTRIEMDRRNAGQDYNIEIDHWYPGIYDREIMREYARYMFRGEIELDKELLMELLENGGFISEDVYEIFTEEDYYHLLSNKDFILEAAEKTGATSVLANFAEENVIREILQDKETIIKIFGKDVKQSRNFLNGDEELLVWTEQLIRCEELCKDKDFIIKLIDNLIETQHNVHMGLGEEYSEVVANAVLKNCKEHFADKEITEKLFDLLETVGLGDYDTFELLRQNMLLAEDLSKDEELAYRYWRILGSAKNIDNDLLRKRDFLVKLLDDCDEWVEPRLQLPKEFRSDLEIVKKYISKFGEYKGIVFEILNNEEISEIIKQLGDKKSLNSLILEEIAKKIEETGTIVTHFGDDLDNKSMIEAIQRWAEDNDLIRIGEPLKVIRVPAGQVREGYLNVDTGGHRGSRVETDGTIVIDGDLQHGVKSACEALSKLGIYVPEQIVELADTKPNKVSSLDSRSGLALVRYLSGEQTFKLAEAGLLDKTLTDKQIEEFGLTEAHKKQQAVIDNATQKIEQYTVELPNGEKIVLSPEPILAGSAISYEKGIKYFVSASEHLDANKNVDGVTFAITSKPGSQLPEGILAYGRELVEKYRIDENSSGVFVSPNNQMIVAGGPKNPEFRIPNISVEEILNEIKSKFMEKKHSIEEIEEYVGTINDTSKIAQTMSIFVNSQLENSKENKSH